MRKMNLLLYLDILLTQKMEKTDMTKRSITFAYNGGPGSSSYWLHMGILGPKRVVVSNAETIPPPPYKMEDNANSILDVSDLCNDRSCGYRIESCNWQSKE
jgi:carboxypeptidase C (cathepsin A)